LQVCGCSDQHARVHHLTAFNALSHQKCPRRWSLVCWSQVAPPGAFAARRSSSTPIAVPDNAPTVLPVGGIACATMQDPAHPTRITVCEDGWYYVFGQVTWEANPSGSRSISLLVNGTSVATAATPGPQSASERTVQSVSTVIGLSPRSYVELVATQTSGGPLDVISDLAEDPGRRLESPVLGIFKAQ
jgi:hypothetical protein